MNDDGGSPHYPIGLVVENQPPVCTWLVDCLVAAFPDMIVSGVASLRDARAWTECHLGRPDVASLPAIVLVDLGLPDGSGVDLIGELACRAPGGGADRHASRSVAHRILRHFRQEARPATTSEKDVLTAREVEVLPGSAAA